MKNKFFSLSILSVMFVFIYCVFCLNTFAQFKGGTLPKEIMAEQEEGSDEQNSENSAVENIQEISNTIDDSESNVIDEEIIQGEIVEPPDNLELVDKKDLAEDDSVFSEKAQDEHTSIQAVEIDGDNVEFFQDENKVIINGNVIITKGETQLICDRVEYFHATKKAFAYGNVILKNPQGQISGDDLIFNFEDMTGEFVGARIVSAPYYGKGETISKVGDNHMVMDRGYITTCDLDKPHYKMYSKKIDIYPGDKVVARSVRMIVGKVPLIYIPRFTQVIDDTKPRVTYTPGYDKDWGAFLLTAWRYYFNDNFKGNIHLDIREKKDFAVGLDLDYKTLNYGEGLIKTYYMNERNITAKRWWLERPTPTIEKERFKVEWRHKWRIDNTSNAIWQYYKLSDSTFLKDYFEREYDNVGNPETFFLFTKSLTNGLFSFRIDKRVNRFVSSVERLPEIGYSMSNQAIGSTGFYFESNNLYSNLSLPDASPTEVRKSTMRIDSENKISYPKKVGFVDFTPYVAQRETFYSKTKDTSKYNIIRSIFETGATLSTKFYKTLDVQAHFWGMNVDRLRHIITPSVSYVYRHDPSFPSTDLDIFDSDIDSITRYHGIDFSLENKLQTKRDGKNVDLLRAVVGTDFLLKENPGSGSFNDITTDIEFRPTDWLTFYSDSNYSAQRDKLVSANFEVYINTGDKWSFSLSKRYHVDVDDQITAELNYVLNPKWKFKIYERFDINHGLQKEQEFTVTRDLHCWEMDISFNEKRGQGSEIWMVFRLKAFPDMAIDLFGTSFNRRKAGSQSNP